MKITTTTPTQSKHEIRQTHATPSVVKVSGGGKAASAVSLPLSNTDARSLLDYLSGSYAQSGGDFVNPIATEAEKGDKNAKVAVGCRQAIEDGLTLALRQPKNREQASGRDALLLQLSKTDAEMLRFYVERSFFRFVPDRVTNVVARDASAGNKMAQAAMHTRSKVIQALDAALGQP